MGIHYGTRKKHAVWLGEVKRQKWGGLRTSACGMQVQPQTFRGKKGQRYLKPFDPATAETCQQCLRCINSRLG